MLLQTRFDQDKGNKNIYKHKAASITREFVMETANEHVYQNDNENRYRLTLTEENM